jgi:hypothetical protein
LWRESSRNKWKYKNKNTRIVGTLASNSWKIYPKAALAGSKVAGRRPTLPTSV